MARDRELIDDVIEAENQSIDKFQPLWDEAKRNSEIYGMKHWTTAEENTIKGQGRIPYKFDILSHPVTVLLGLQEDARFDISFYERSEEDGLKAELMNLSWRYFANKYDFIHVESDVFKDSVVGKYGVFGCEIDKNSDVRGDLKISRVPYNEILWDKNFRQYDLSDAYWMSRMRFYRRDELRKKVPKDKQGLVELAGLDTDWSQRQTRMESWYRPDKDLVSTREFFEKNWVRKYFIWQKGSPDVEETPYRSQQDAEAVIKDRILKVSAMALMGQYDVSQGAPEWEVVPIDVQVITKSEVMINGVIQEPEEYPLGDYPYTVVFSYFQDGEFWSLLDRLKDHQIFTNRMFSHADHWIGTSAKGLLIGDRRIPDREWKMITDAYGKTGGAIRTKYADSIKVVESKGPAPQLFSLIDRAVQILENNVGGANLTGLKETASESGRAVLARQAQAGMDFFTCLDNLRRTKQNLGLKVAWYLTNEISAPRTLRIVGDSFDLQAIVQSGVGRMSPFRQNAMYVDINTNPQNTLSGLEVDIVVDEAAHSPTKNQAVIAALVDAGKAGVMTVPPPPEVLIGLLPIPASLKRKWLEYAQAQSQQPKEPPAKPVSINYKDIPPDAKVQALESLGLETNPVSTVIKEVMDKPHLMQSEKKNE